MGTCNEVNCHDVVTVDSKGALSDDMGSELISVDMGAGEDAS